MISSIGCMFAPHHQDVADELVRVCKPGGTIGLLSWTPEGMLGALFRTMGPFMPPPPPGAQPPPLWGSEEHLRGLFGGRVDWRTLERDELEITAFEHPRDYGEHFKARYGPTIAARANAVKNDREAEFDEALDAVLRRVEPRVDRRRSLREGVPARGGDPNLGSTASEGRRLSCAGPRWRRRGRSASALVCLLAAAFAVPAVAKNINGSAEQDRLQGTSANDRISAGGKDDRVSGGGGDDFIDGGTGDDGLNGSSGNDRIVGQSGKDEIDGGSGNDNIDGGESDDTIVGGPGEDRIVGGNDDDTINVRDGERDVVSCGTGNEDGVTADPVDSVAGDCESGEQAGSDDGDGDDDGDDGGDDNGGGGGGGGSGGGGSAAVAAAPAAAAPAAVALAAAAVAPAAVAAAPAAAAMVARTTAAATGDGGGGDEGGGDDARQGIPRRRRRGDDAGEPVSGSDEDSDSDDDGGVPIWLLILIGLAVAGLAFWLIRRRRESGRTGRDPDRLTTSADAVLQVRHARRLDRPDLFEPELRADAVEQACAAAEHERRDVQLELVDEAGSQVLVDGVGSAADRDVLAAGRRLRLLERRLDPVGHEGERRVRERQRLALVVGEHEDRHVERRVVAPPSLPRSSPQGPGPPPNLPRPMISAPTFAIASSRTALLALTSPPSLPCGSRHALRANDPVVQALAALAERILLALVRSGHVAVRRH